MSTSDKIKDIAVGIFIVSLSLLTLVALAAIWDVFEGEVVLKAFTTIGIIGFAAVVVVIAANYLDKHNTSVSGPTQ